MGRTGRAIAVSCATLGVLVATAAWAAEPKAAIQGELDRGLRQDIARAIGEVKNRAQSPLDARRRAREAAGDAAALLRSEGYYDAKVEADISAADPPTAIVRVTPGARFQIRGAAVRWVGAPPAPDVAEAAIGAVRLAPGVPGRAAEVLAAEGRIVAALERRGYADAKVEPREVIVDHADRSVRPTYRIAAGERVRLDGLEVTAKGRTNPAWVRSLTPWKRGAIYDPETVAKLERRLIDTGVYESVTVVLAPTARATGGLRPVVVNLAERPPRTLELGAAYSATAAQGFDASFTPAGSGLGAYTSIDGSGVDAKWIHYNVLRRADTITLTAKLYDIQQVLDLLLALPDWRRGDQTLRFGADALNERTPAYDDAGGGVRATVERRWAKTTFVTVGGYLDYVAIREKNAVNGNATPVDENLKLFITTGLAAFALDRSNSPLNPSRGWRLDARTEPTWITGDRNLAYLKAQTQASAYLPLDRAAATVIAGRVKLGAILGGSIPDVPTDRRLFAGGGGSVRGYGYQAVGPRLSDNTPEGGLSLVEGSIEARRRITEKWGVVAFVDAGTVGLGTTPDFRDFSVGAGIGARYDLGFGPLRLDIATPLNPRLGDAVIQVYLSIGQSF